MGLSLTAGRTKIINFCGRVVGELAGTAKKGSIENGGNRQKGRKSKWREGGVNFNWPFTSGL